jgi:prophage tail gpP-like protein/phage tail protein X
MYRTTQGDTFELIARKVYGDDKKSSLVASANAGLSDPLPVGVAIITPTVPVGPMRKIEATNENEIAVIINGRRFRFWTGCTIKRSIDSFDTIELSAPFEPDADGWRDVFRPFSYQQMECTIGGVPLFRGTVVSITPALDVAANTVTMGAYSLPGVLNDCTAPASMYPLEYNGVGLSEIARSLCDPFGIFVDFKNEEGAPFERAALEPSESIFPFLASLAKQRGLIMTSDAQGSLVFWKGVESGAPVAKLKQGASPVIGVGVAFEPQAYFSDITGIEAIYVGLDGSQTTKKNPHLEGVLRPHVFPVPDAIDADSPDAVASKFGRMFSSMAAYSVDVATWRDPSGELWRPNTIVSLYAPRALIYSEYNFLVKSVTLHRTTKSETATLELVMNGSLSGEAPEVFPWDA